MAEMGFESWECPYCREMINKSTKTVDHIIPRKHGGAIKDQRNVIWACAICNHRIKKEGLFGLPSYYSGRFSPIVEDGEIRYVIKDPVVRRYYIEIAGFNIRLIKYTFDPPN
jgi:ribosomal protein L37AE/L43A